MCHSYYVDKPAAALRETEERIAVLRAARGGEKNALRAAFRWARKRLFNHRVRSGKAIALSAVHLLRPSPFR